MSAADYGGVCPCCGTENPTVLADKEGVILNCCDAFDADLTVGVLHPETNEEITNSIHWLNECITALGMAIETSKGSVEVMASIKDKLKEERSARAAQLRRASDV